MTQGQGGKGGLSDLLSHVRVQDKLRDSRRGEFETFLLDIFVALLFRSPPRRCPKILRKIRQVADETQALAIRTAGGMTQGQGGKGGLPDLLSHGASARSMRFLTDPIRIC
jgi:hypothetical protein